MRPSQASKQVVIPLPPPEVPTESELRARAEYERMQSENADLIGRIMRGETTKAAASA